MKTTTLLGIALLVLGLAGVLFGGFSYTTRDKVVDLGGLHVTAETRKTVPIPLIAGAAALIGGVAVIVVASRKSRG